MAETLSSRIFVNSEQVGDYVDIVMPATDKKTEEEIRIHYLEAGIGEPLLLIHGIGQSLYTWRCLFSELSESYRVIAVDLPGHGYSGRPEQFCYSMDEMAEALKLFMDAKGIFSAHIMAFSTGSIYMMRLLKLYPQYVANCIAISPGGITKQMPSVFHNMKSAISAVFSRNLYTAGDVRKWLLECVYDKTNIDDRVVEQYYTPIEDGLTRENLMYAVRNFDLKYVTDEMKDVDHEILLLWGREDKWHTPNSSIFFQGILQNGRYFLVRNAGHLVQEDTPDKLLQVIVSYIPPTVMPHYNGQLFYTDLDLGKNRPEDDGNAIEEQMPGDVSLTEEAVETEEAPEEVAEPEETKEEVPAETVPEEEDKA